MMGLALDAGIVLDALSVVAWTALPDGRVDFVNRKWSEYTGLGLAASSGSQWQEAVSRDDLPELLERRCAILASGEPGRITARLRRCDGQQRWFDIQLNPIRDAAGQIVRWCGTCNDIDDLRRAEDALDRRALDLQLIVDSIPVPVTVTSPTGEVEGQNQLTLDYFGKSFEELKAWRSHEIVHPDDLDAAIAAQEASLASGKTYNVESRHRRADGVYRWVNVRGFPLRDGAGSILRWFLLCIDIEDRKRAELTLAESERHLNETINALPALVWSARPDGTGEFYNQFYLDYLGRTLSQVQDHEWTKAVHPDDLPGLMAAWTDIMASRMPGAAEARMQRYDGHYRWFLFRTSPLRDQDGNVVKWYGVNIDIDDRKRAEEELRRSEAFLAEGQALARMGNFSWDADTDEIAWSEQIYHIFDFEPGTPVTLERIAGRAHPEDLGFVAQFIEQGRRGESDIECQHRLLMPDQSVKHLHLIAHRTTDRPGRKEYSGTALDISQRRSSEEALDKARAELSHVARVMSLGALTASIAHEVNQPLAGIVTNASTCLRMLAAVPPNIEGAQETARRTIRDGNRAADVITRLRALFTRRSATIEPVDLGHTARDIIALMQSDLDRARVVVRMEFADGLPFAGCDRVQVQQVIMNLLRNAAEAMSSVDDRPRRVTLTTEAGSDETVRFVVRDSGIGFDPQDAERLFDAFYTTRQDGMGIGLAISRSIIESLNGRLWAEIPVDGPGAIFSFSLPVYGA
ncbi:PAS domain S-box protein [Paraburkholderia guartelaensis]|uniref:histidine kinase n=1 Tax=Paraburkholderia guartelaensis TaxID=2546446 RepID=A0A4R5L3W6_9BURK|nr:PAS domain-containing protein [Paraburkholderia guartelaensis]TDG03301.1 PAS domain S-box protein [Paraburkholderia guartelaensis]